MTGKRGKRRRQLLDDLKETRVLKNEGKIKIND